MLASLDGTPPAERAWAYFKESIRAGLEENYIDTIGFSAGYAGDFDLRAMVVHDDKSIFRVWFGRIIDAVKPQSWNFAEIDFYYHYAMNDALYHIAEGKPKIAIEDYYRKSDGERIKTHKIEAVFAFADEKPLIWDTIRELKPINVEIRFCLP